MSCFSVFLLTCMASRPLLLQDMLPRLFIDSFSFILCYFIYCQFVFRFICFHSWISSCTSSPHSSVLVFCHFFADLVLHCLLFPFYIFLLPLLSSLLLLLMLLHSHSSSISRSCPSILFLLIPPFAFSLLLLICFLLFLLLFFSCLLNIISCFIRLITEGIEI